MVSTFLFFFLTYNHFTSDQSKGGRGDKPSLPARGKRGLGARNGGWLWEGGPCLEQEGFATRNTEESWSKSITASITAKLLSRGSATWEGAAGATAPTGTRPPHGPRGWG